MATVTMTSVRARARARAEFANEVKINCMGFALHYINHASLRMNFKGIKE
jgi:hypothetical protein